VGTLNHQIYILIRSKKRRKKIKQFDLLSKGNQFFGISTSQVSVNKADLRDFINARGSSISQFGT